jgi:hypothetical protein
MALWIEPKDRIWIRVEQSLITRGLPKAPREFRVQFPNRPFAPADPAQRGRSPTLPPPPALLAGEYRCFVLSANLR